MIKKSVFINNQQAESYRANGYVVATEPNPQLAYNINQLVSYFNVNTNLNYFYYSLLSLSKQECIDFNYKLNELLKPLYSQTFTAYRSIAGSFLIKPANTSSELMLHQDWAYTYEDEYETVTCWIPLTDVNETNGAIFLIPASHTNSGLRSASYPTQRLPMVSIPAAKLKTVNIKAGQLLCFHPAVWHGSHPNNSNLNRVIATSIIIPADAPFVYFNKINPTTAESIILQDDGFENYLNLLANNQIPTELKDRREFTYNEKLVTPLA